MKRSPFTRVAENDATSGFVVRSRIICDKTRPVTSAGRIEPALYPTRKGKNGHWAGGRNQTTVWLIDPWQVDDLGAGDEAPISS